MVEMTWAKPRSHIHDYESESLFICPSCQWLELVQLKWNVHVDLYESELTRKLVAVFIIKIIIFSIVKIIDIPLLRLYVGLLFEHFTMFTCDVLDDTL